jgi:hypothetical protein
VNRTVEALQAKYATRLLVTAVAVTGTVIPARLIWLGKTGDYLLPAIGLVIVGVCVGWMGARDLHRRWVQLRQFRFLQERGPYDRREHVPPQEAARQLGDEDGPNMWRWP